MPRIQMLQSYEIGHRDIDADHRGLIDAINRIAEQLDQADAAENRRLMDSFVEQVSDHFSREETILAAANFPRLAQHRRYHATQLEEARSVRDHCNLATDPAGCFDRLVAFFLDDVIRSDLDFKSFLLEAGQGREDGS